MATDVKMKTGHQVDAERGLTGLTSRGPARVTTTRGQPESPLTVTAGSSETLWE